MFHKRQKNDLDPVFDIKLPNFEFKYLTIHRFTVQLTFVNKSNKVKPRFENMTPRYSQVAGIFVILGCRFTLMAHGESI